MKNIGGSHIQTKTKYANQQIGLNVKGWHQLSNHPIWTKDELQIN